jgi:hypothetical protein
MKHLESRMQVQCVKWFRLQYRQVGDLLIHVPNGGSRDLRTAQRLKAEGVLPGVADLVLFIPNKTHHGLFIELKIKPNKQSTHQKDWEKLVTAMNYHYVVVYSFDDFKLQIESYIGNT